MKYVLLTALISFAVPAFAAETAGEKVKSSAHDAKRATKKGAHRVAEKLCMKDDAECLADKAKHRAQEAGDATKDKARELKNKVD